mmetsp:Transcript_99335/g.281306  ORF Transcript_99335/g.281306 Transcript_99335/m.281306 type:complete len:249 (-) Transcript_99335:188-934(-)
MRAESWDLASSLSGLGLWPLPARGIDPRLPRGTDVATASGAPPPTLPCCRLAGSEATAAACKTADPPYGLAGTETVGPAGGVYSPCRAACTGAALSGGFLGPPWPCFVVAGLGRWTSCSCLLRVSTRARTAASMSPPSCTPNNALSSASCCSQHRAVSSSSLSALLAMQTLLRSSSASRSSAIMLSASFAASAGAIAMPMASLLRANIPRPSSRNGTGSGAAAAAAAAPARPNLPIALAFTRAAPPGM